MSRPYIYFRLIRGLSDDVDCIIQDEVESRLSSAGIEWLLVMGLHKHSYTIQEQWYRVSKDDGHLLNLINDGLIDIIPDEALDNIGYDR